MRAPERPVTALVRLWGPVVAYMTLIFYLSSLSQVPGPSNLPDKVSHAVGYLALAVLVVRALAGRIPARLGLSTVVIAWTIAVGYGATDEFHQRFVPGRTASAGDLLADALGASAGVALCWAWGKMAA